MHYGLFEQADNFRSKSHFPDARSNNQNARFLFYRGTSCSFVVCDASRTVHFSHRSPVSLASCCVRAGRINAVKLHYSDAYADFSEAIRKAPVKSALGFRQKANKFQAIVQLLMGEIPDRAMFRQADLKKSLKPYFRLTQVRLRLRCAACCIPLPCLLPLSFVTPLACRPCAWAIWPRSTTWCTTTRRSSSTTTPTR